MQIFNKILRSGLVNSTDPSRAPCSANSQARPTPSLHITRVNTNFFPCFSLFSFPPPSSSPFPPFSLFPPLPLSLIFSFFSPFFPFFRRPGRASARPAAEGSRTAPLSSAASDAHRDGRKRENKTNRRYFPAHTWETFTHTSQRFPGLSPPAKDTDGSSTIWPSGGRGARNQKFLNCLTPRFVSASNSSIRCYTILSCCCYNC